MEPNTYQDFETHFSKAMQYIHVPKRYYITCLKQLYSNKERMQIFLSMLCDNHYIVYLDHKDSTEDVAWRLNHVVRKMRVSPELPEDFVEGIYGCDEATTYLAGKNQGAYIIYGWDMNTDGTYAGVVSKENAKDFLESLNKALEALSYTKNSDTGYIVLEMKYKASMNKKDLLEDGGQALRKTCKSMIKGALISLTCFGALIFMGMRFREYLFYFFAAIPLIFLLFFVLETWNQVDLMRERKKCKLSETSGQELLSPVGASEKKLRESRDTFWMGIKGIMLSVPFIIAFIRFGTRLFGVAFYVLVLIPILNTLWGGLLIWSSIHDAKKLKKNMKDYS